MTAARVADYDRVADRYDRRYALYAYDGVRETLRNFLTSEGVTALEVGCGTGHWLRAMAGHVKRLVGVDPSAGMLAAAKKEYGPVCRARAEALPWPDASFDRVFCVNALHHFSSRTEFFAEARRVLRPGGALMTIGKDPHAERDEWWVYDYFEGTRAIDRARFAPVRVLRGELTVAGFSWAESFEADRIEAIRSYAEAQAAGVIDPAYTSQLTVLTDEEFARGIDRLNDADADRGANGAELQLISDFRLYATVGWV